MLSPNLKVMKTSTILGNIELMNHQVNKILPEFYQMEKGGANGEGNKGGTRVNKRSKAGIGLELFKN